MSARTITNSDKSLVAAILEYLSTLPIDSTSLEIVCETLGEQTGVYRAGPASLDIAPFSLEQLVNAGKQVFKIQVWYWCEWIVRRGCVV